jgi:hypothetical protein
MKKVIVLDNCAFFQSSESDDYMDALRTEIWVETDGDEGLVHIDTELPGLGNISLTFTPQEISRLFGESGGAWSLW